MLKNKIQKLADQYFSQLVAIRRYLHANPELSFCEQNTSLFLEEKFRQLNIPFKKYAENGLAGVMQFGNPSHKIIALRADMDALPIQEQNEVDYKSVVDGVMHACGHDVHMTCMLGAMFVLQELKNELQGTVKVIFQPAEEKLPGGAKQMIHEGVLNDPEPEVIFALHVYPELPAGKCGFHPGFYMSSSDELYITIIGKGGHAAIYNKTLNPVLIAAEIISELNALANRLSSKDPYLISIGKVEAKGATNIIPDKVHMEGTIRTFNENFRKKVHEQISTVVYGYAERMGGKAELEIRYGYPTLYNDPLLAGRLQKYATELLGEENVARIEQRMTSEDFAFFALEKPSVLFRLGINNPEKGFIHSLHTDNFDVDEEALKTGTALLAYLAYKELMNE